MTRLTALARHIEHKQRKFAELQQIRLELNRQRGGNSMTRMKTAREALCRVSLQFLGEGPDVLILERVVTTTIDSSLTQRNHILLTSWLRKKPGPLISFSSAVTVVILIFVATVVSVEQHVVSRNPSRPPPSSSSTTILSSVVALHGRVLWHRQRVQ